MMTYYLEARSENGCKRSEIGSGFKEPGGKPPPGIHRSTPLPPPDAKLDVKP